MILRNLLVAGRCLVRGIVYVLKLSPGAAFKLPVSRSSEHPLKPS